MIPLTSDNVENPLFKKVLKKAEALSILNNVDLQSAVYLDIIGMILSINVYYSDNGKTMNKVRSLLVKSDCDEKMAIDRINEIVDFVSENVL